jgi:DNA helicase-2/ATP-dependent DNA helicase PcrA
MQTSFRLPAAPLVLAKALIKHNDTRHQKTIRLVRGFDGDARLIEAETSRDEAVRIANAIRELQAQGTHSLEEMTILVRTYAQTPPLEQVLLDRGLPYVLHGHAPFYRRREVQPLLRYLYWALLERRRRSKGWFDHPQQAKQYVDRFSRIINTPNRYVAGGRVDRITQEALDRRDSVLDATGRHLPEMQDRTAERVESFLEAADGLVNRLEDPADTTLEWLVKVIDYETALREQRPSPEHSDARTQAVRALIRYAAPYDTAFALLNKVQSLTSGEPHSKKSASALDLRSIHRAKGLEWPVVFVPGCTDGTLPLKHDEPVVSDVTEERRLFYVAVTRTQKQLYLSTNAADAHSSFLDEAELDTRLPLCRSVQNGLNATPEMLSDEEVAHLCRGLIELGLESYVQQEWSPSPTQSQALASRLDDFSFAITEAKDKCAAYRKAQDQHEQAQDEARTAVRNRLQELRDLLGNAPFNARHEASGTFYPEHARFEFEWSAEESEIAVCWNETQVAFLDPLGVGQFDAQTVMALPWHQLVGRFAGLGRNRQQLQFIIDWDATEAEWSAAKVDAVSSPDPPSDRTRLLTCESVRAGCAFLRERLASEAE